MKWQEMYQENKGKIDEGFAFLAFRTAPLVSATTMDAKVASSEMAANMMTWGLFGKPNQREWVPSAMQRDQYPGNDGLYSSGYRVFQAHPAGSMKDLGADAPKAAPTQAAAADAGPGAGGLGGRGPRGRAGGTAARVKLRNDRG